MTTNVDKVRTNEGYFKTRFARDGNTITAIAFRLASEKPYHPKGDIQ